VKKLLSLAPELEALLAPHRTVQPLAPSIETRVLARAVAAAGPELGGGHWSGQSRVAFAVAAGAIIALGAATYAAARSWMGEPSSEGAAPIASSIPPPGAGEEARGSAVAAPDDAPTPMAALPAPGPRRMGGKPSASTVRPPVTVRPTNAELQLLRAARQSVTRGDFEGALAVIAAHLHRFRDGALVEEREALRVKSLAGLGRHEEAQRAADRFRARFPDSVFLSTFDRMKDPNR
jgi:hypothetical protein